MRLALALGFAGSLAAAVPVQPGKTVWPLSLRDGIPAELPGYAAAPRDPLPDTDENEMGVYTEVSRFFQRIESPTSVRQFRLVVQDYGAGKDVLTNAGNPAQFIPFSAWTGMTAGPFALTFRDKTKLLDLSGGAKIRWATKTSGFHGVRPVIKLADGSMFVGDVSSENVAMMAVSEFPVATVRWVKLDPMRVVTLGSPGPFNQIWVTPDLSKVDEVGFADLIPGSGHGTGGWVHVGSIEVYGKAVPRGPN